MTGTVNWQLEAVIIIEMQDATGGLRTLRCSLDTGFDGDIALPAGTIAQLGLVPVDVLTVTLADSTRASMPKYNAGISWHGQFVEAEVLRTEHESAIGTGLLENSTLTIQVWDGGEVRIEPRQPSVANP